VLGEPHSDSGFVQRLTLDRVDRDIFTGYCHAGAPLRAFGGQVAAQALVAAGNTVDDEARHVHSLHAYFLRPGRTTDPIIYLVERARDSRSFSTRRVKAIQYGETIFTMSASFAIEESSLVHQIDPPDVPRPEDLEPFDFESRRGLRSGQDGFPSQSLFDLRIIQRDHITVRPNRLAPRIAWMRTTTPLPDDLLTQVCALTYFSDLTLIGTILEPHGGRVTNANLAVSSLDHAMWFHAPFRADDWVMFVMDSPVAAGGHGLARGEFYRPDGTLIASAVQEALLRAPKN
jgi:acyl-CoA thioesterase-2